jgi:hypothetical protein
MCNTFNDFYRPAEVTKTQVDKEREYLRQRLRDIHENHVDSLRVQFYLDDDAPPKSVREIVARIKDGKFEMPAEKDDNNWNGNPIWNIRWRDPSKPADHKGFDAAEKKLEEAFTAAKDQIMVMDAATGLKALQEFESFTVH